jgi:hypothetical protein
MALAMSVQDDYVDGSAEAGNQFVQLLLGSRWLLGLFALGVVLILLGVALSGLVSGILGTYGIILVAISVLLYLGLAFLKLNPGS